MPKGKGKDVKEMETESYSPPKDLEKKELDTGRSMSADLKLTLQRVV